MRGCVESESVRSKKMLTSPSCGPLFSYSVFLPCAILGAMAIAVAKILVNISSPMMFGDFPVSGAAKFAISPRFLVITKGGKPLITWFGILSAGAVGY